VNEEGPVLVHVAVTFEGQLKSHIPNKLYRPEVAPEFPPRCAFPMWSVQLSKMRRGWFKLVRAISRQLMDGPKTSAHRVIRSTVVWKLLCEEMSVAGRVKAVERFLEIYKYKMRFLLADSLTITGHSRFRT